MEFTEFSLDALADMHANNLQAFDNVKRSLKFYKEEEQRLRTRISLIEEELERRNNRVKPEDIKPGNIFVFPSGKLEILIITPSGSYLTLGSAGSCFNLWDNKIDSGGFTVSYLVERYNIFNAKLVGRAVMNVI